MVKISTHTSSILSHHGFDEEKVQPCWCVIGIEQNGQRLDKALTGLLSVARSVVQTLFKREHIVGLDGQSYKPSTILKEAICLKIWVDVWLCRQGTTQDLWALWYRHISHDTECVKPTPHESLRCVNGDNNPHTITNHDAICTFHETQNANTITNFRTFVDQEPDLEPSHEAMPPIIYEDDHVMVLHKPSGLVMHVGAGHLHDTLAQRLLHYYPPIRDVGQRLRPGLVHRLDKETSGVVIVTKSTLAYQYFVEQIANRKVKRLYDAYVHGTPKPEKGEIIGWMGRHAQHRQRMYFIDQRDILRKQYDVVYEDSNPYDAQNTRRAFRSPREVASVPPSFKYSHTNYETTMCYKGSISKIRCALATGRTHQIRVHLRSKGLPIIGDEIYGSPKRDNELLKLWYRTHPSFEKSHVPPPMIGIALHAYEVQFHHPITHQLLCVQALPEERLIQLEHFLTI